MGQVSTEQTVEIIDSVTRAIDATQPDIVTNVQPDPNYWWLLILAIIPVVLGWYLRKKK